MKRILISIFAAAAAGCATTANTETASPDAAPPATSGELIVGALPESALPEGECGMILWTLEAERPTPIFRLIADKGAQLVINGEPVTLSVVESSGAAGFGVFEQQSLEAPGLTAEVMVRFGLGFDGGAYLERGLLTVESADGWRTVIPAAGIAGCRAG